ncbi:ISL3 family transposase [Vagococcus bubulae]
MNNHIKKMLRITDDNLNLISTEEANINGMNTLIIKGTYSPMPSACKNCHSSIVDREGNSIIVKNGKKEVTIRLLPYQNLPTILKLKKQRFYCRKCCHHWTAQCSIVEKNCHISKFTTLKILELLTEKISMTLIAKLCQVSLTTVLRVLKSVETQLPHQLKPRRFPEVLMVDEFRSHATNEDKMSFICADGKTGELVDILPSRKLDKLTVYFNRTPLEERKKVKFLVTDMNAAYFQLTKKVFPTAGVIIDRFHVIKHLNTAFNEFRVREMKVLISENKKSEANKLKTNWKFLLKNQLTISISEFKTWRSFPSPKYPLLTESMMIDRLLSFSPNLKEAYDSFQLLTYHFRNKDADSFFELLKNLPNSLDRLFKDKLKNLLVYETGIRNALLYDFSNGKIEAKNTHIKTLKRVSYGFKSFSNMRIRIFLINGLIKIK